MVRNSEVPTRIVVVDDDPGTCAFLHAVFTAEGHECHTFTKGNDVEQFLAGHSADLVMIDVYLGALSGVDLLLRLRSLRPEIYPVIMTAHVSVESAAQSVAHGAIEYVSKPITVDALRALLDRVVEFHSSGSPSESPPADEYRKSAIIGRSPKLLNVYNAIARVAPSSVHVLISGASGTGKELVARAIHRYSKRADRPFTPINCGSFTETIIESELFGHEKGAFTGAESSHKGLIESSDGGTVFLDEITETSLTFQVKLLRVIQEQQLRRVGSAKYVPIDVRFLAATNRDISELIRNGDFREDLYYRLGVVQIAIPALNERREDIPLLIRHFLGEFNADNGKTVSIEPAAIDRLQTLDWPGNVRELENTIHRLAIFARAGHISLGDINAEMRDRKGEPADFVAVVPDRLLEMERQHILRILQESHGNKAQAARRLGIERKTLYKKAARLGIDLQTTDSQ